MIFRDENGKIYEVPEEKYSEFKVSDSRAKEIIEAVKKEVSENVQNTSSDVQGYNNMFAFSGMLDANGKLNAGSIVFVDSKPYQVSNKGWKVLTQKI